jgi:hypothetical protein
MENDDSPEWPTEGYSEGDGADLGGADHGLSDHDLGYDEPDSGHEAGDPSVHEPGDEPGEAGDAPGGHEPDDTEYTINGSPELGHDTGEDLGDANDFPGPDTDAYGEVPGTDPDVDPMADDDAWHADPFPQSLDLDQPEPVDGMPWSDPALLGDSGGDPLGDPAVPHGDGAPPIAELYEYDGGQPPADGSDPWQSLSNSEDPATSSLARFWSPG